MKSFTYEGTTFYKNGEPYRILSGTIHYFRVVPEYWEDRLKKLKACGMNTVETYACWNLHERKEGCFDFNGILDLEGYIRTAGKLGLNVILRPGPYICAEWDMGGLPSWLLTYKGMHLRCYDRVFLEKTKKYLNEICKRVKPYLISNGGNVIAIQVENEYGSYGDDKRYLEAVADIYKKNGMDCLLFTSDGPEFFMLNGGSLPGCLAAVNFGSRPKESFRRLKEFRPDQPLLCCEYWNGWFDHWYETHHTRESSDTASVFEEMLKEGASVNFYMFHGGTNFGFYNGSNYAERLQPDVTSYDYNCPITESGDLTPKYYEIRDVVKKYFGSLDEIKVGNLPRKNYGRIQLTQEAELFDNLEQLSKPVESSFPMTMEELGQDFGFVLYRSKLKGPFDPLEITIDGIHDRAIIYINGKKVGVQDRVGRKNDKVILGLKAGEEASLDILVENLGRINYGSKIWDEKGIIRGVKINQQYHYGYTIYPLPCDNPENIIYKPIISGDKGPKCPVFLRGTFEIEELADTFVRPEGFTKGNIYINGFNLGRYWNEAGPQKTLYLPAPLLKKGLNEIVLFELENYNVPEVWLTDEEDLG